MNIIKAGVRTKLVVMAMLTYLVITLLNVMNEIQDTQAVSEKLQQQIDVVLEENEKMSQALENKDDPAMQEQVMRDRGYVKVGETMFFDSTRLK